MQFTRVLRGYLKGSGRALHLGRCPQERGQKNSFINTGEYLMAAAMPPTPPIKMDSDKKSGRRDGSREEGRDGG